MSIVIEKINIFLKKGTREKEKEKPSFFRQRCQGFLSVSVLPLQADGFQDNRGAKSLHSCSFPLIIANVNKCWLALYTCLACKSTLIGCAKIEGKSNLHFHGN